MLIFAYGHDETCTGTYFFLISTKPENQFPKLTDSVEPNTLFDNFQTENRCKAFHLIEHERN